MYFNEKEHITAVRISPPDLIKETLKCEEQNIISIKLLKNSRSTLTLKRQILKNNPINFFNDCNSKNPTLIERINSKSIKSEQIVSKPNQSNFISKDDFKLKVHFNFEGCSKSNFLTLEKVCIN